MNNKKNDNYEKLKFEHPSTRATKISEKQGGQINR